MHALLAATVFARAQHAPGALPWSRAYWRVSCTRLLQPQASRVHNTRQAFSHATRLLAREMHAPVAALILWRVLYTRLAFPHHYPAATCQLCHVSSFKKKKIYIYFDPDPIFSARSNGLEPDLLKWVRPSIGPRVSVF
jgi:hypothetical protein